MAGEHAAAARTRTRTEAGPQDSVRPARAAASVLYLQSAAGNQAVNTLLQRTVFVKNAFSGQIEPVAPSASIFPVSLDVLAHVLQPLDRYDEATGMVLRASGEQLPITSILGGGQPTQPQGMEVSQESPALESMAKRAEQRRQQVKKSSSKQASEMTEGRKARSAAKLREVRSESRSEMASAGRAEVAAELASLTTPMQGSLNQTTGQPEVAFAAGDETHRLYPVPGIGRWRLMIASHPLPIADFILEMEGRFNHLKAKAEDRTRVVKVLPRLATSVTNFTTAKAQAAADLGTADTVFATVTSTVLAKVTAEENLAKALHKLIEVVKALAKRLGKYVSEPGKAYKAKSDPDYYYKKMSSALERYRVEGLVARYQEQPGYEGSDFERDHQPHNDLIETMATLPEFAGKKLVNVAAGRTQLGWSIMLHHDRHALGRTFGLKGGSVTTKFRSDLATYRSTLPNAAQVRQFCIDYLVQSLKDDVAAMKVVANSLGNYSDLVAPITERLTKALKGTSTLPTATDITNGVAAQITKVQAQILAGEDRILSTESEIREYDK